MESITIMSLNVAANTVTFGGLAHLLRDSKPDIIGLQEVACSEDQLQDFVARYHYSATVSLEHRDTKPLGVAVLWKTDLDVTQVNVVEEGRCIEVIFDVFRFFTVYPPPGQKAALWRREFFSQTLLAALSRNVDKLPIIAGDFNCVLAATDIEGGNLVGRGCPALVDLLLGFRLLDAWRLLHPRQADFTWRRPGSRASRLDRIYVPRAWSGLIEEVEHLASLSDHDAVLLTLRLPPGLPPRPGRRPQGAPGGGFWKMNVKILDDQDFWINFGLLWPMLLEVKDDFVDVVDWWDTEVKPSIKTFCIDYSIARSQNRKGTISSLYVWLARAL